MKAQPVSLSAAEARRLCLSAQGFGSAHPARVGASRIRTVVRRLGAVQIDSVNVLVRAHYLPIFSRLGGYDRALLARLAYGKARSLFEYWGHEASLLPVETFALLRWRMDRARRGVGMWRRIAQIAVERHDLVMSVERTIRERGPMAASDFEAAGGTGRWWGWSDVKRSLEFLFWSGTLTTARRTKSFERIYDLTERVLPDAGADAPIDEPRAQCELVRIATRAHGVATEADLRDYFRLGVADAKQALATLLAEGAILPVTVEGWKQPAYLDAAYRRPRRVTGSALLAPFDPLVWNRARTRRLFAFDYRLEIYTPSHKRVHGYYVLPYLLDERLVARIDAKADRSNGILRVHAVHYEAGVDRCAVFERLRSDVTRLAAWLGLESTRLPEPGASSAAMRRSTSSSVE